MKKKIALAILLGSISLSLVGLTFREHISAQATEHHSSAAPSQHHSVMAGLDLGPADEKFDLRFIDALVVHHSGALEIAEQALERSSRDEVKQLAQEVITAQQREIEQLTQWRRLWYPGAGADPVAYDSQTGQTVVLSEEVRSNIILSADLGSADESFDLRFIDALGPHHGGAVVLARQALEKSERPEIRELAQNVIDSQTQEMAQLEQWRQVWYGQQ